MGMEVGKVKWFNDAKGFGFIVRSTGEDVFVHYSAIEGKGYRFLYEGQEVEFECIEGPKGFWAKDVQRISGDGPEPQKDKPATAESETQPPQNEET